MFLKTVSSLLESIFPPYEKIDIQAKVNVSKIYGKPSIPKDYSYHFYPKDQSLMRSLQEYRESVMELELELVVLILIFMISTPCTKI